MIIPVRAMARTKEMNVRSPNRFEGRENPIEFSLLRKRMATEARNTNSNTVGRVLARKNLGASRNQSTLQSSMLLRCPKKVTKKVTCRGQRRNHVEATSFLARCFVVNVRSFAISIMGSLYWGKPLSQVFYQR